MEIPKIPQAHRQSCKIGAVAKINNNQINPQMHSHFRDECVCACVWAFFELYFNYVQTGGQTDGRTDEQMGVTSEQFSWQFIKMWALCINLCNFPTWPYN